MARVNLTLSAIANMRARTFTSHSLCVRGTLDRLIEAHSTVRAEVNLRPRLGVDKRVYDRAKAGVATRASDSREYPVEDSNRWKRPGQNPCHTPPLSQVGKYDHRQRYEGNPGEQKRTDEPCPASQIFPDRHDSPYGLVEAHAAVGAVIESRIPPEDRSSLGTQHVFTYGASDSPHSGHENSLRCQYQSQKDRYRQAPRITPQDAHSPDGRDNNGYDRHSGQRLSHQVSQRHRSQSYRLPVKGATA